MAKNIKPEF